MSIPKQLASGLTFELFAKWANKTILAPQLFIDVPVASQEGGR